MKLNIKSRISAKWQAYQERIRTRRKERALDLIRQRHQAVNRHVFIQTAYIFKDECQRKEYISIDGLRISEYLDNEDDKRWLESLREQYYKLHRHELLGERI